MPKQLVRLAFIVLFVSLSCSMPVMATQERPTPQAVSQISFVTAAPNSTSTPTPFQPIGPTGTSVPTETPLPTETATPVPEEPVIPTPVRVSQDLPEGTINMLVLGSDWRPSSGYRTDVIVLVSIHPEAGVVNVISFPRDLYVTIPGWTTQRINTAFPHGGFSMMADTMEYNFGVRPTHYVLTNFEGFKGIINSLGGITVNAGSYLSDKCDLYWNSNGYCTVNPGPVEMDGDAALWYVRSRYSSSDFDRTRRAQEVLYAIFSKLMSVDAISRLPEFYSSFESSVETNIGVDTVLPLVPIASQVFSDSSRIQRYAIGPGQVWPYITETGAQVLLPNYEAIAQIISEAVFNP